MTCRTYDLRHYKGAVSTSASLLEESFKKTFGEGAVFVRSIRKGQTNPTVPEQSDERGIKYLAQTLGGETIAETDRVTSPLLFEVIGTHESKLAWQH